MIRFAWTRFRTQAAVGACVLAIAAIVLLVTGIQLAHAYDTAVAACKQHGNCAGLFNAFLTQGYFTAGKLLGAAGLAVPGLIGMFWGAPLVARELETGTFRLVWTQGVTRTRWLTAKLAIAGVAAIAAGELFTLMVAWWSSPIHKANAGYTEFTAGSFHTGVAPVGYAAFAFALGVTAGLFIRRTLPAMAVTLAVFTAVIIAFPIWVRPHLIPPVQTTSTLSLASIATMPGVGAFDGYLSLAPGSAAAQACNDYIESLRFRQTVTYQPASRYWAFQWVETAIYLALALA
ncbi:MAG: ABC transporter permease subunit, partial [Streptosporangiaceae bacterium]